MGSGCRAFGSAFGFRPTGGWAFPMQRHCCVSPIKKVRNFMLQTVVKKLKNFIVAECFGILWMGGCFLILLYEQTAGLVIS